MAKAAMIQLCVALCIIGAAFASDKKTENELFWYGPAPGSAGGCGKCGGGSGGGIPGGGYPGTGFPGGPGGSGSGSGGGMPGGGYPGTGYPGGNHGGPGGYPGGGPGVPGGFPGGYPPIPKSPCPPSSGEPGPKGGPGSGGPSPSGSSPSGGPGYGGPGGYGSPGGKPGFGGPGGYPSPSGSSSPSGPGYGGPGGKPGFGGPGYGSGGPGYGGPGGKPGSSGPGTGEHGGGCPCGFWSSHFGSWPPAIKDVKTIAQAFGPDASKKFGDTTLVAALQSTKTDPYSSLLKQSVTSLLNAHKLTNFQYTPNDVKSSFNAAIVSSQAASVQASKFEQANNGYGTQGLCV